MTSSAMALLAAAVLAALPMEACAQASPATASPQYATAAVHLAAENRPFTGCETQPARLHCILNLRALASRAYSVRYEFVLQAPRWAEEKMWDLEATIDPEDLERVKALSPDQRGAMMQSILADRFGLKVHTETRPESVFDLVIAKGGHKLQPSAPATDAEMKDMPPAFPRTDFLTMSGGTTRAFGVTMNEIVHQLPGSLGSDQIDRPILDKTGLTGNWNFTLSIEPQGDKAPSPFTTLEEQLGLKLVPAKEPVPVLVIDASHLPTEN
ncbi:TIGR03435 family protein [Silvibacterium sp.]|uniref:TIGR03435 family protein n=1 Tax=Silvibacterium sp. TaxID=1964179 RepID=UPI0039E6AF72